MSVERAYWVGSTGAVSDISAMQRSRGVVAEPTAENGQLSDDVAQTQQAQTQQARTPKDEIKRRVEAVAVILDMSNLLDRKPRALSGGQRQRVGGAETGDSELLRCRSHQSHRRATGRSSR